jgi:hypothetical protein
MSFPENLIAEADEGIDCGTCGKGQRALVFAQLIGPCSEHPQGYGFWCCRQCAQLISSSWAKASQEHPTLAEAKGAAK